MHKLPEKFEILGGLDLITAKTLMAKLHTTRGVADNTLSAWHQEGFITKVSAGCYLSGLRVPEDMRALWQACDIRLGAGRWMLIGASAWAQARWDIGVRPTIYIATCDVPSTQLVEIMGVESYPVGQITFNRWREQAVMSNEVGKPYSVHPISQMLWWMSGDCPAPMSEPDDIDWDVIAAEPLLIDVLRRVETLPVKAPKSLNAQGFPLFYSLAKETVEEIQRLHWARHELDMEITAEVPR